ncbi:hypothetical protein GUITHDRAFT_100816 [Guillardia theta CCMP2712]|uniref:RWP-RK domain-containing protein n=1 Tax=Guillardia theta (strain CCMP2712) TaxID=905079 RepID=L1K088_GUITC|nr:hypothetical protein GUITHDRAFT_100816 [Guillardia theta CCMP2712]EKX53850.1 hypothetical protein GUITHDRAFT_100816 [Guillardia theta CCMP2712]|eukprot:XP_005840830.1 hypothetical protein GUITHDRAFT_100816 [Guillardia theta CCMP2712]
MFSNRIRLFPRRKLGEDEGPQKGRLPLVIDITTLQNLYGVPLVKAAKILGISLTTLKQVCRRLGIQRWPYQKPRKVETVLLPPSLTDRAIKSSLSDVGDGVDETVESIEVEHEDESVADSEAHRAPLSPDWEIRDASSEDAEESLVPEELVPIAPEWIHWYIECTDGMV